MLQVIIAAIIGLVLGGLLQRVPRWLAATRQTDALQRSLSPEIDRNLTELAVFWAGVRPRKPEDEIHHVDKVVYAREFALAELPHFSREAFDSHKVAASRLFRSPQSTQIDRFYSDLASLESAHAELRAVRERDIAVTGTSSRPVLNMQPDSAAVVYDEFLRNAGKSWDLIHHTIDRMLLEGNPLPPNKATRPHAY